MAALARRCAATTPDRIDATVNALLLDIGDALGADRCVAYLPSGADGRRLPRRLRLGPRPAAACRRPTSMPIKGLPWTMAAGPRRPGRVRHDARRRARSGRSRLAGAAPHRLVRDRADRDRTAGAARWSWTRPAKGPGRTARSTPCNWSPRSSARRWRASATADGHSSSVDELIRQRNHDQGRERGAPPRDDRRADRPHDRQRQRRHPPGAGAGRAGGADDRDGPAPRRNGRRQRGVRAGHPQPEPASAPRDDPRELRRDSHRADRERAVRPRAWRLHRCVVTPDRQVRGRQRIDDLPRRDRRFAPRYPGQAPAGDSGAHRRAARRQPVDRRSTSASSRRPIATSKPPWPTTPSARISSTA